MGSHNGSGKFNRACCILRSIAVVFHLCSALHAQQHELRLQCSRANTSVRFTLGDVLHTVHGSCELKQGDVDYKFGSAAVQGSLVIDATSGQSEIAAAIAKC